jgi:hypothetical protein
LFFWKVDVDGFFCFIAFTLCTTIIILLQEICLPSKIVFFRTPIFVMIVTFFCCIYVFCIFVFFLQICCLVLLCNSFFCV